jgi:hypothetical protein
MDIYYVVYFDDIFIYFKNMEKHENYVRALFKKLREYKLYAKIFKCEFHIIIIIEFFGFIITVNGVSMDFNRVDSIWIWPKS